MSPVGNQKHYTGEEFNTQEKAKVMVTAYGEVESVTNKTVQTGQRIYSLECKHMIPTLLEYLLQSKDVGLKNRQLINFLIDL